MEQIYKQWVHRTLILVSLLAVIGGSNAAAQSPSPESCENFGRATINKDRVNHLYDGRAATGAEAEPIVDLLEQYGVALQSGNPESMSMVITSGFDENLGWSECSGMIEPGTGGPEFDLTPVRVTTVDEGVWLGFVQRSHDDGSANGYQDIFMVVVVEDEELGLLIDFAHRDVVFEDGSMVSAEEIYLNGVPS